MSDEQKPVPQMSLPEFLDVLARVKGAWRLTILGHNPLTGDPYWTSTGIRWEGYVWYGFVREKSECCGTVEQFQKHVQAGRLRFRTVKKGCGDEQTHR